MSRTGTSTVVYTDVTVPTHLLVERWSRDPLI
jgi:hypothetical protein